MKGEAMATKKTKKRTTTKKVTRKTAAKKKAPSRAKKPAKPITPAQEAQQITWLILRKPSRTWIPRLPSFRKHLTRNAPPHHQNSQQKQHFANFVAENMLRNLLQDSMLNASPYKWTWGSGAGDSHLEARRGWCLNTMSPSFTPSSAATTSHLALSRK